MGAFSGVRTLKSIRGTFSSGGLDLGFRGVGVGTVAFSGGTFSSGGLDLGFRGVGVGLASFFSRNLIN